LNLVLAGNANPGLVGKSDIHNFFRRRVLQMRTHVDMLRVIDIQIDPIEIPNKGPILFSDAAQVIAL
jgi:hypothetical protein